MRLNLSRYFTRILLTFVSFYGLPVSVFAQEPVFSGYYIGSNSDTVKGTFPHYRQWNENPTDVSFLPQSASALVTLTPASCSMFHINGFDSYVAYRGTRLVNAIDINSALGSDHSDNPEEISTFLRVVVQNGRVQLLAFSDKKRTNFYIRENGKQAEELKFKVYLNADQQLVEVETYRDQLAALFKNEMPDNRLHGALDRIHYNETELARFMERVMGPGKLQKIKKKTGGMQGIIAIGGFSVNTYNISGDRRITYEANTPFSTSLSPVLGLGYIMRSNRNFGKLFLFPQVKVYRYKNEGVVTAPYTYPQKITYQSDLVMNVAIQVGYDLYRNRSFTWYVAPGVGLLYLGGNMKTEQNTNNSAKTYYNGLKMTYNVNIQTGITLSDKLNIWTAYNVPSSTMKFVFYNCFHTSVQAGIGYRLTK